MLTRLSAIGIGAVALGALFFGAAIAPRLADSAIEKSSKSVTLIYVGAKDCAPCEGWQRNQGAAFRNASEFNRVFYREIKSPSLFDVLKDENWPQDLRQYRKLIGQDAGVPLWLVVVDNQLVMQRYGLSQWQEAVLPKLKSLLR